MTGVEHRDATFSRRTRDVLARLAERLDVLGDATAAETEEDVAELRDVVARWDGNEATAIFIETEPHVGDPDRRIVELYRRRNAAAEGSDHKPERIAYWEGRIDEYALEHEISAHELDAARDEAEGLVPV